MNKRIQTLKSIFTANVILLFGTDQNVVRSVNSITENFSKLAKSRGLKDAIKIHKEVERHCKMSFLHQKSELSTDMWMKQKSGFPKYIYMEESLMNKPEYARAMLTALAFYRLFTLSVDDNISNIIKDGPDIKRELLDEIEKFAFDFYKSRGIKPFEPVESKFPAYATTKAGANGSSAMGVTSLYDILALERDSILTKIVSISSKVYTNNELLIKMIDDSLAIAKSLPGLILESLKTGRLHLLAEGGGKTRVICIPDIWTQSVLKPIHQYFMNCLRKMPCDGSFGHEVLGNKVKKFTKHRPLFCFDLTAATDRFPLEIQKAALKPLLGDLVHEWSDLLVNRTFSFKSKEIRYKVGQPMGLLTSWAAFSLSHHIIINYCKNDKSFYAMIGDDVGISSVEGARRYQTLMKEIGVSINDSKSLIPKSGINVAEIAKRQFIAGNEISPIPPRVLIESTKGPEGLLEFLQVLANRTGKFRDLSELEKKGAKKIILANKDFNTELFQVLLTCPLKMYNPFTDLHSLLTAQEIGVVSKWNTSMPVQTYQNEMEQYILNIAVNKINSFPLTMESLGMGNAPRTSVSQTSPLIFSYLDIRREELKALLRESQAHQGSDDWDDDHVVSPESVYEEIVSGPDPLQPKDFMEKKKIRRKRTIDLLYRMWQQSRFAKVRKLPLRSVVVRP
jgi:hypothetical protein